MHTPGVITQLLRQIQAKLQQKSQTIATAESCSGGLLAYLLTELPGSSAVYLGGVSTYANAAKTELLAVDPAQIERFGAVSTQVAEAMAAAIRARLRSTYALSLTGIAGPGGGSEAKPVGTVFCALAGPGQTQVWPLALRGDRQQIRWAAAEAALHFLNEALV